MRVDIQKHLGCYNFANPSEKSWNVRIFVEGMGKAVSVNFPEDDEPDTDDQPPSEVVALMRARIASYIYWGGKEEAFKTFAAIEANEELVNAHWAQNLASKLLVQAQRLTDRAKKLAERYPMPEAVDADA